MEKPICPLCSYLLADRRCQEEGCAWWLGTPARCSLPEISLRLCDITAALEAIQRNTARIEYSLSNPWQQPKL